MEALNQAGSSEGTPPRGTGILLPSDLWLDQPDAGARLEARRQAGELSDLEAARLRHFAEQGYLTFEPGLDPALLDGVVADVERLWREKPRDLAYAYDGPARPMSEADEARERRVRYRIHDLHSHSPHALALYLDRRLFDLAGLVLGEEPVAVQSLYFEYGSEQVLHRDPVVVPTASHGHLLAAWIALEDIGPDCGALLYVPGSHRLPYFEFAPGEYRFDARTMGHRVAEALAFDEAQCARHGLAPRLFTAKKGEVLLWHAGLRHGGGPVRDGRLSRKSLVVHYTSRRTYGARSITVCERVERAGGAPEERFRVLETTRLVERDGARGYDNPMRGSTERQG